MAEKWEGKATARLRKPTPDQVWPLLEDFFNLHKWLPAIDTCRKVEGAGQLRYCAATSEGGARWCHEELVEMDPIGKRLSYRVLDNNLGMKGYESTIKVLPIDGGDGPTPTDGCMIEWCFLADPIEGFSCGGLVEYLDVGLQGMARNMERDFELRHRD